MKIITPSSIEDKKGHNDQQHQHQQEHHQQRETSINNMIHNLQSYFYSASTIKSNIHHPSTEQYNKHYEVLHVGNLKGGGAGGLLS
jgi:tetraacyldisaccharide-1-P 4'-kinase